MHEMQIKLIDFGLACHYKPNKPPSQKCGTIITLAPEIILQDFYGPEVDLWSLGVILYEMLSNKVPFYSEDKVKIFKQICFKPVSFNNKAWSNKSMEVKDLIVGLLQKNPQQRLTVK